MSKDQILDSLGRIDDEVILTVNEARAARKPKLKIRRWAAMAACFALVLSMALTAEATNGTVSNLLAPLFGGAQTEIVDKIGVPIDASTTVNGYTLTADAVIGDRYNVAIVYTFSRDDGQPIPEDVFFLDWHTDILKGGSGGGTLCPVRDQEDPGILHFVEIWNRRAPLIGRLVTSSFSTLAIYNEGEEYTILSEGTWELTYTLRYEDSSEKIWVRDFHIKDYGGKEYELNHILLSPVGIYLNMTLFDPDFTDGVFRHFDVSLILNDGTEVLLEGGGGGRMAEGDKRTEVSYSAMFDIPIPREDIKAIVICGTTYELNNSD